MEKIKPIMQFRDAENKLVSASVFKNTYGKSIALNISFSKDGKLEQRSLTILQKTLPAVLRVLKQVA